VPYSRRALLTLPAASAFSQTTPLNRFPRMVQEWFVTQVREAERRGLRAKAGITTRADAENYVYAVRQKARACFGPMPARTPLNARTTKTLDRSTYKIENVIFESRPGFLVTANLYVPKGLTKVAPGVVGSCGHTDTGKAGDTYQSFAQGLARQGYVVLIFDPIGQGERLQYVDDKLKSFIGPGTSEHLLAGNQQVLIDECFAGWRAWDGIRALDYLLTRPEVDAARVGITGNSGGGTMTTWLCALEDRWSMAAPSCFVTTFRRNMENELAADSEQYPWRAIAQSLDMDDFVTCMAPKPVILLGKERDYFDARGFEESFARLKRLYTLLGKPENISSFLGAGTHGFTQDNREAMYRWFNRATGSTHSGAEDKLQLEDEKDLWATPDGQVALAKSKSIVAFTRERSRELAAARTALKGADLRRVVTAALKMPSAAAPPDARILRPIARRGFPAPAFATYAVETEPGIHAIVYWLTKEQHLSRPPRNLESVTLYVSHHSADRELRDDAFARGLVADGAAFCSVDVRGVGESRPGTGSSDDFNRPYGSDYFYAGHSLMLDAPYVGRKTFDVLRVIEWLRLNAGTQRVHLAAAGWGTLPATFAALLSDTVTQVTLAGAPQSYASIAESERYTWPLSSFVPGVLRYFDLPDCYTELEGKGLRRI
jgi:dienelactone hydrolase